MQNQDNNLMIGHKPYVVDDNYAMVHRNENVAVKKEGNVSRL